MVWAKAKELSNAKRAVIHFMDVHSNCRHKQKEFRCPKKAAIYGWLGIGRFLHPSVSTASATSLYSGEAFTLSCTVR